MDGKAIALLGLALCAGLCGVGSAIGLFKTGSAAAGVLAENNKKFTKVIALVVLPATQGIYGFVMALVGQIAVKSGMSVGEGWQVFAAVMPLAITGLISAVYQGMTSASCIYAVAKDDKISGKMLMFPIMVETYALLGLVISIVVTLSL